LDDSNAPGTEKIDLALAKWTGVDGVFEVHEIPGKIAMEVGVLGDIKQQLASFNRARIDDSNAPGMEGIGVDLAKLTGVNAFFDVH
jgi:hypothetical protein